MWWTHGLSSTKTCLIHLLAAAAALLIAMDARAQSGANVLLVVNTKSPASVEIGDHYARARAVPQDNVLRLAIDLAEEIARPQYISQIESPISAWFKRRAAMDRVLYIVLTKGVPLRIAGTSGKTGTVSSVDSELTMLYPKLAGVFVPPQGPVPNPYFLGDRPIAEAKPFTHEALSIFLVTRLDGFTVADVLALIDRGGSSVKTGRFALDEKATLGQNEAGNQWLERTAETLKSLGFGDRVLLNTTSSVIANEKDLLGYYSWGSNDPSMKDRDLKLAFAPGALAGSYVSTDGRTFKEPPASWKLGTWQDSRTYFEGSPQSLTGDLIRAGVTGVSGHVAEPFLDATIRPDVLFPAYTSGLNLAESFYLAMPYLSWQTIIVGDPLCAPFRKRTLTMEETDPGIDAGTELPKYFSSRLMKLMPKTSAEGSRLFVLGSSRLDHGDRPGAQKAFEEATALDPKLTNAQLLLAALYNAAGEYDKGIERYRRSVANDPNHVVALNDLAYALATHQNGGIPEALTVARKAYGLAKNEPSVTDTLAWILHLAGNDAEARPLIAAASNGSNNPEIQLHAATIDAATGAYAAAAKELARAVELNPELDKQPEVQRLRAAIERGLKP